MNNHPVSNFPDIPLAELVDYSSSMGSTALDDGLFVRCKLCHKSCSFHSNNIQPIWSLGTRTPNLISMSSVECYCSDKIHWTVHWMMYHEFELEVIKSTLGLV